MIIIDPGHGGREPNDFRVAPNGLREAEINLRVAIRLTEILLSQGIASALTRTEDIECSLADRIDFAKKNNAKLLLSIHHNSYEPKEPFSDFPLVYVQNKKMVPWAKTLLALMEKRRNILGGVCDGKILYEGKGLYLLREFPLSLLSEYAFFSQPETAARMLTEEFVEEEALVLAEFVVKFLSGNHVKLKKITSAEIKKFLQRYPENDRPQALDVLTGPGKKPNGPCPILGRLRKIKNYYG